MGVAVALCVLLPGFAGTVWSAGHEYMPLPEMAAAPAIGEKSYRTQDLGGADVFTFSHCWEMQTSLRND